MFSSGLLSRSERLAFMGVMGTELVNSKFDLFTNAITPTENTVIADFDVATFPGYAQVTVAAWGNPGFDVDGVPYLTSGVVSFEASGASAELMYGFFTSHGIAPTLPDLMGKFAEPIPIVVSGDACNLVVKLRADGKITILTIEDMP